MLSNHQLRVVIEGLIISMFTFFCLMFSILQHLEAKPDYLKSGRVLNYKWQEAKRNSVGLYHLLRNRKLLCAQENKKVHESCLLLISIKSSKKYKKEKTIHHKVLRLKLNALMISSNILSYSHTKQMMSALSSLCVFFNDPTLPPN